MENLEKLNDLKVRIQILDSNDQVLIHSSINLTKINDLKTYTNVSALDEIYSMLIDELKTK
jgi:hypothetical protein